MKLLAEGLPFFDLYKKVYSKYTTTSFMATASGGHQPQSSHMVIDESNRDEEVDLSELPGQHSGEKRPSCSNQQPKQSKKKNGMMPSINETFINVCTIMIDIFGHHK